MFLANEGLLYCVSENLDAQLKKWLFYCTFVDTFICSHIISGPRASYKLMKFVIK